MNPYRRPFPPRRPLTGPVAAKAVNIRRHLGRPAPGGREETDGPRQDLGRHCHFQARSVAGAGRPPQHPSFNLFSGGGWASARWADQPPHGPLQVTALRSCFRPGKNPSHRLMCSDVPGRCKAGGTRRADPPPCEGTFNDDPLPPLRGEQGPGRPGPCKAESWSPMKRTRQLL